MKIPELEIKKYVKLSNKSRKLIGYLNQNSFDLEDFLQWWIENKLVVGDSHVIEYLEKDKKKEG